MSYRQVEQSGIGGLPRADKDICFSCGKSSTTSVTVVMFKKTGSVARLPYKTLLLPLPLPLPPLAPNLKLRIKGSTNDERIGQVSAEII